MVQRARPRSGFVHGSRRKMVWARDFNFTTNSAGLAVDLLAGMRNDLGISNQLPGMTITRIVGTHDIRVVSADDAFTRWVWGLTVQAQAQSPGAGANPLSDPERDWLFVRQEGVVQVQDEIGRAHV